MARSFQQGRKKKQQKKTAGQAGASGDKQNKPEDATATGQGEKPQEVYHAYPYTTIEKKNKAFEDYYKEQNIVPQEEWDKFMSSLQDELPVAFRITGNRSHAQHMLRYIKGHYISALMDQTLDGVTLERPKPMPWYPDELAWQFGVTRKTIRKMPEYKKLHAFLVTETESGNISRQEAVSMIPPLLLDVKPQHKVLDMCAAPGSKTAQLIELVHADQVYGWPEGFVIANDSENKRCYIMVHQTKRLNSPCSMIVNHDATVFPTIKVPQGEGAKTIALKYDRILCDVPCSGDGTLRKNFLIWKKWTPMIGLNLHIVQHRILQRGAELLEVGGRMVYSTCSFNPIENEAVVAFVLQKCEGTLELVDVSDELPGLKRTPGLTSWKVINDVGEMYASLEDVPEDKRGRYKATHWPPTEEEAQRLKLNRCIRVLPHHQNTGGFFVAVLRKTAILPWMKQTIPSEKYVQVNIGAEATPDDTNAVKGEASETAGGNGEANVSIKEDPNPEPTEVPIKEEPSEEPMGEEPTIEPIKEEPSEVPMKDEPCEEPMGEEPIKEEPATEPIKEEPSEVPMKEEPSEEPMVEEPSNADTTEEPTVENTSEVPKASEPTKDQPAEKDDITNTAGRPPPPKKKKGFQGYKEDPFVFFKGDEEFWPKIKEFYTVEDNFPLTQLLTRCYGGKKRNLYFVNSGIKSILETNEDSLKVINSGVKMWSRSDAKDVPCDFRLTQEGIYSLYPYLASARKIANITKDDVRTLLTQENPYCSKLEQEARDAVNVVGQGSLIFVYDPKPRDPESNDMSFVLVGWRGKNCVRSYIAKGERQHILRLCDIDIPSDIAAPSGDGDTCGDADSDTACGTHGGEASANGGEVQPTHGMESSTNDGQLNTSGQANSDNVVDTQGTRSPSKQGRSADDGRDSRVDSHRQDRHRDRDRDRKRDRDGNRHREKDRHRQRSNDRDDENQRKRDFYFYYY